MHVSEVTVRRQVYSRRLQGVKRAGPRADLQQIVEIDREEDSVRYLVDLKIEVHVGVERCEGVCKRHLPLPGFGSVGASNLARMPNPLQQRFGGGRKRPARSTRTAARVLVA